MGLVNGALKHASVSPQFPLRSNHKVTEGLIDRFVGVFGNDRREKGHCLRAPVGVWCGEQRPPWVPLSTGDVR